METRISEFFGRVGTGAGNACGRRHRLRRAGFFAPWSGGRADRWRENGARPYGYDQDGHQREPGNGGKTQRGRLGEKRSRPGSGRLLSPARQHRDRGTGQRRGPPRRIRSRIIDPSPSSWPIGVFGKINVTHGPTPLYVREDLQPARRSRPWVAAARRCGRSRRATRSP